MLPPTGEANTGAILTGLSGGGCAIAQPINSTDRGPKRVDPMLPMLSMFALMGLVIRRRVTVVKKRAGKVVSVAAVAIASLFLG